MTRAELRDVERFRSLIGRRYGLDFDDGKLGFLEGVLSRAIEEKRQSSSEYLADLERGLSSDARGALARELTVPETYFFRNVDQFRAFAEVVLPERLRAQGPRKRLRILSAGCASGEEAYSIAIQIKESLGERAPDLAIRAVDLNPAALARARKGRYTSWSLREAPLELQQRWFRKHGREVDVEDAARNAVRFEERNLAEDDPDLWQVESYDVVFCRNVIMYFTPEQQQVVVQRIARALVPGGYLFLGHAETLRGLSDAFHLRHTHDTFYYERRREGDAAQPAASDPVRAPAKTAPSEVLGDDETWVRAIQTASDRIHAITQPSRAAFASVAQSPARWDLGVALELLRRERFGEALDSIRGLPEESAGDRDVLLLRAVLLSQSGESHAAEQVCRTLLSIDELNAGAHYVLALCREGVGDPQGAIDHDQVAVYLDPAFAMPRLHLGLMARRRGDDAVARRELSRAFALLGREEASRLLLFGGGFTRDALIALCRGELLACGGKP